jgi:hypothetical protein
VCIVDWNEPMDYPKPSRVRPDDLEDTYDESHFDCARCLVWAILFEAGLGIATFWCWHVWLSLNR